MATMYEFISRTAVSNSSSITLSSLPQNYSKILIVGMFEEASTSFTNGEITVNGLTSSIYDEHGWFGNDSQENRIALINQSHIDCFEFRESDFVMSFNILLHDYASTSRDKLLQIQTGSFGMTARTGTTEIKTGGVDTSSPITSIKFNFPGFSMTNGTVGIFGVNA